MKHILVVDDLRFFGETYDGLPITYARTSSEALRLLDADGWQNYEQIFLDHDLGPDDDARVVGRYLEELSFVKPQSRAIGILVVSDNPAGRKELELATRHFFRLHTLPKSIHERNL